MSHPERVKKSVRLDIRAIAIISDYAAKHGCNETDAMNRIILATQLPPIEILATHSHPQATHDLLEDRLMALETQMDLVLSMLTKECDRVKPTSETSEPIVDMELAIEPAIDLKPTEISAEPEQIGDKRACESIRDLASAGISAPEFISLPSAPEFTKYIEPVLKPYTAGGYYFRFEDVGQPELKAVLMAQAKQMGFSSQGVKLNGKHGGSTRIWLNREYCKHTANIL